MAVCLTTATAPAQQPLPWTPDGRPAAFAVLPAPGVAPATFHVNALSVPLAAGTPLTATYQWNFGDPAGRYNGLPGWVAAHVYDRPGTYPITLAVTDEAGHRTELKQTVTVAPDTRRAVYVAPDGDDANNGATAAVPLKSAAAGFRHLAGGHAILLFKAGGTYPADNALPVAGPDVVVGRYGEGPQPVLLLSRGTEYKPGHFINGTVSVNNNADGVTIQHLTFTSPYTVADPAAPAPKVGVDAIVARGRNVVVRGCSFRGVDDAVNANGNPAGLLVQDCDAPGPTDLRAYLVWGQGTDHAYLGNTVGNSTREHNIRIFGLTRVLMYDNDLTNLDRTKTDPSDQSKGTIQMQLGSFGYIAHNRVAHGSLRTGPRGGSTEKPTTATDWCVVDGNDLTDTFLEVQAGSHHVMFRNNVVHMADGGTACHVSGPDDAHRTVADITFAHNTAVATGPAAIFLRTFGRQDGLALADNLFVAPHLRTGDQGACALYVLGGNLDGFAAVSHNVWPVPEASGRDADGVCVLDPAGRSAQGRYVTADAWVRTPPVAGDLFLNVTVDAHGRPAPGTPADAVPVPGTEFDHDGHPRPRAAGQWPGAFAQPVPAHGNIVPR